MKSSPQGWAVSYEAHINTLGWNCLGGGGVCFFDKNKTLVLMAALVQTRVRHNNQLHKRAALSADGKQGVQVELSMQIFARHNLHASTTRN